MFLFSPYISPFRCQDTAVYLTQVLGHLNAIVSVVKKKKSDHSCQLILYVTTSAQLKGGFFYPKLWLMHFRMTTQDGMFFFLCSLTCVGQEDSSAYTLKGVGGRPSRPRVFLSVTLLCQPADTSCPTQTGCYVTTCVRLSFGPVKRESSFYTSSVTWYFHTFVTKIIQIVI